MSGRPRAADDFAAIRERMAELAKEREMTPPPAEPSPVGEAPQTVDGCCCMRDVQGGMFWRNPNCAQHGDLALSAA